MIPVRTVEAVYEGGYLRPLEPLEAREGLVYIVTVLDIASIQKRAQAARGWRGKYRGYLSPSADFARDKETEKTLER